MQPFLNNEALDELAREFPPFEERYAMNEFGEVGRKAYRPDLPS